MKTMSYKRNRWVYAFAGLTLTLVCLLTIGIVYQRFPTLPGALEERLNVDELTQLVVPGSVDVALARPGAYGVYYEYRSVVDDVKYETGKQPPDLVCHLTSKATGARMDAVPDFVETNTYRSRDLQRVGVLLMSISIDDPGIYSFACQYGDDRTQPKIVVSVGPNLMWEFFNGFAKIGGSILCGTAGLFLAAFVGITVIVLAAIKRSQTEKNRMADDARQS